MAEEKGEKLIFIRVFFYLCLPKKEEIFQAFPIFLPLFDTEQQIYTKNVWQLIDKVKRFFLFNQITRNLIYCGQSVLTDLDGGAFVGGGFFDISLFRFSFCFWGS